MTATTATTRPPIGGQTRALLEAPLLPTLLRLATPNVLGLFAATIVIAYDGYIVGRVGADALAGVALVFPLSMLMLQMSAGGMGGAIAAAVARALGAGRRDVADRLAQHAVMIGAVLAAVFTLLMLLFGRGLYAAMGGRGAALEAATAYSQVLFGGALVMWIANSLAAVARGGGQMVLPSAMLLLTAGVHLLLCPTLVFGFGPLPGVGVGGAAASTLVSNAIAGLVLFTYLARGQGAVALPLHGWQPNAEHFRAILRVGIPASVSPLLSNGSIAAATALIGSFGTAALAGFGLAARLEYIMVPIAFGFGTALTTLVGANMGAGLRDRATRAAWTGALLVAAITGGIGGAVAIAPELWMDRFSSNAEVLAFGSDYLHIVGASYGLFGMGLALFFASQGAGRMFWPLAGSIGRLLVVAAGGWVVVKGFHAPAQGYFLVIAGGFVLYALTIAGAIALGAWAKR